MEVTCTRRIQFAAGHRVYGHESKCANLHGHNYVVYIHARPKQGLDSLGRVIDFSVLKEKFGTWIDTYWDHGFIYYYKDKEVYAVRNSEAVIDLKWFTASFNPTAEEMAGYLLTEVAPDLLQNTNIEVFKITVWETENCYAEAEL